MQDKRPTKMMLERFNKGTDELERIMKATKAGEAVREVASSALSLFESMQTQINDLNNRVEKMISALSLFEIVEGYVNGLNARIDRLEGSKEKTKRDKKQSVAALMQLGASLEMDEKGRIKLVGLSGPRITDSWLTNLKGLTRLITLQFSNTQITDAGLEHLAGLTKLHSLNLEGTKITNEGLKHLTGLKQLEILDLTDTQVTDEGIQKLKQSLPDCEILR